MLVLAATCSLPAAAQASDLPSVQPAAAGVTAQLGQTATAAGAVALDTTAQAQVAVQQTAAEVVAPARPAVERAAETVTKASTAPRPAVDTVVSSVETAVAPTQPVAPAPAAKRAGDGVEPFAARPPRGRSRSPGATGTTPAEYRQALRARAASERRARRPRAAVHAERTLRHGRVRVSRRRRERHLRTRCRRRIDGIGLFYCLQHRCRRGCSPRRSCWPHRPRPGASGRTAASLRPVLFVSVLERPG